jgi:hypothetical protein
MDFVGIDGNSYSNSVIVYLQNVWSIINSGIVDMDYVQVFNVCGRLLAERKSINGSTVAFINPDAEQVLLLKITSSDNITLAKKAVN